MEKLWLVVNGTKMKFTTPIVIEIDVGVRTLLTLGARSNTNWGERYNICLTIVMFR
jgi:hypothetical protein